MSLHSHPEVAVQSETPQFADETGKYYNTIHRLVGLRRKGRARSMLMDTFSGLHQQLLVPRNVSRSGWFPWPWVFPPFDVFEYWASRSEFENPERNSRWQGIARLAKASSPIWRREPKGDSSSIGAILRSTSGRAQQNGFAAVSPPKDRKCARALLINYPAESCRIFLYFAESEYTRPSP